MSKTIRTFVHIRFLTGFAAAIVHDLRATPARHTSVLSGDLGYWMGRRHGGAWASLTGGDVG